MRVSCVSWRVTVKCSTVCAFDGASAGGRVAFGEGMGGRVAAFAPAFAAFVAGFAEDLSAGREWVAEVVAGETEGNEFPSEVGKKKSESGE